MPLLVSDTDTTSADTNTVCENCGENVAIIPALCDSDGNECCLECSYACDGCGSRIAADPYHSRGDFSYCENCAGSCDDCAATFPADELDEGLCESCLEEYSACYRCDERVHSDQYICSESGDTYCDYCYAETYTHCEGCNEELYREEAEYAEEGYYCADCLPSPRGIVHAWDYKPVPIFHAHSDDGSSPLYMGFEVETDNNSGSEWQENIEDLVGDERRIYAKQDCTCNACEIVTHPHSLYAHREFTIPQISELKDAEFRSFNGSDCGLHVHVARSSFRDFDHAYRFIDFVYANRAFCETVAQRKGSNWASFEDGDLTLSKSRGQCGEKRVAVNGTSAITIEVRIFKGTLSEDGLNRALSFIEALFYFTRDFDASSYGAQSYVDFVGNDARYNTLSAWLEDKGYPKTSRLSRTESQIQDDVSAYVNASRDTEV